jgi:hypothetical protein
MPSGCQFKKFKKGLESGFPGYDILCANIPMTDMESDPQNFETKESKESEPILIFVCSFRQTSMNQ